MASMLAIMEPDSLILPQLRLKFLRKLLKKLKCMQRRTIVIKCHSGLMEVLEAAQMFLKLLL